MGIISSPSNSLNRYGYRPITQTKGRGLGEVKYLLQEDWTLHPTLKARPFTTLQPTLPGYFGFCFQTISCPLNILFLLGPGIQKSWRKYSFLLLAEVLWSMRWPTWKVKTNLRTPQYQNRWSHAVWIRLDTAFLYSLFNQNYLSRFGLNQDR